MAPVLRPDSGDVHHERHQHHGENPRHTDADGTHGTLDLTELQRLRGTHRMRRGAEREPPRNRMIDMEKMEHQLCDHIAEDTRDDDRRHGQRNDTARLLRHAHADRRRDRLRQQRGDVLRGQTEQLSHDENAENRAERAGSDRRQHGHQVILQQPELLVHRNREADRRRCQQVAEQICTRLIILIRNLEDHQHRDHHDRRHQQRIQDGDTKLRLQPYSQQEKEDT